MRTGSVKLLAEIDGLAQMSCCETDELEVVKCIEELKQELARSLLTLSEIQDSMSDVSCFIENLNEVNLTERAKNFNTCLEIGNKIRDLDLPEFTQEHSQPVCFTNKGDSEANMKADMTVDHAMRVIDAEGNDHADVRGVVERMIAAGYTLTKTCDPVGFND